MQQFSNIGLQRWVMWKLHPLFYQSITGAVWMSIMCDTGHNQISSPYKDKFALRLSGKPLGKSSNFGIVVPSAKQRSCMLSGSVFRFTSSWGVFPAPHVSFPCAASISTPLIFSIANMPWISWLPRILSRMFLSKSPWAETTWLSG